MKDYYLILDYTNSNILDKKLSIRRHDEIYLSCNDKGIFSAYLKNPKKVFDEYLSSIKSSASFIYDGLTLNDYENADLGEVLTIQNIIKMQKVLDEDINHKFWNFSLHRNSLVNSIVSLETLNSYFLETFEEIQGSIVGQDIFQSAEGFHYLLFAKVKMNEEILEKYFTGTILLKEIDEEFEQDKQ